MSSLIPSSLCQMNPPLVPPQRSSRLLPSFQRGGGDVRVKEKGIFNNAGAKTSPSESGLDLGSGLFPVVLQPRGASAGSVPVANSTF